MATHQSTFHSFLQHVSHLTAAAAEPQEVLAKIVASLDEHLGHARASIRLHIHSKSVAMEGPGIQKANFVFSRPIAVRGREYGQLSVETHTPVGSPRDWMLTLDTLSQQLALYAERLELAENLRRAQAEISEIQASLQKRKALARASGIVARLKGTTLEAAERWIAAEAARRGRETQSFAEQLILHERLTRQFTGARHGKAAVAA